MIQGKWFPTGSDIELPLSIRKAVFQTSRDKLDEWAQQVVVYDGDLPAGTARLYWQDGAFVIDSLAVLPEERRRGFGDLLVRLCLFKALTHGQNFVRLTAPKELVPFFVRYGFSARPSLPNGGIPMSIACQDIHLDGCNGHCDGCR